MTFKSSTHLHHKSCLYARTFQVRCSSHFFNEKAEDACLWSWALWGREHFIVMHRYQKNHCYNLVYVVQVRKSPLSLCYVVSELVQVTHQLASHWQLGVCMFTMHWLHSEHQHATKCMLIRYTCDNGGYYHKDSCCVYNHARREALCRRNTCRYKNGCHSTATQVINSTIFHMCPPIAMTHASPIYLLNQPGMRPGSTSSGTQRFRRYGYPRWIFHIRNSQ